MPVSPARAAAFEILLRVARESTYASDLLHSSRYSQLSLADHGLATELVMGVLRWQSCLDQQITAHSSQRLNKLDPEVLIALRLAAYQLLFLDRVPEHAAVHESVELVKRARKRSAVPFVNAVLRKLSRAPRHQRGSAITDARTALELADASAHPFWLVERWIQEFGFRAAQTICQHDQQVPETTITVRDPAIENELKKHRIDLAPGLLLASARRVVNGDLTSSRPFREGQLAVQEEASQLVALLVGPGSRILDCCAAPGGKTRLLADRYPESEIIAAELHPHRARLLQSRVTAKNVRVIAADARALPLSLPFDRVLADVPCSGTGTLARNPEIKWRLRPEDLADLHARQLAILQSAMQRVTPGGRLVYATCSLEREENSQVVDQALSADRSFRVLDCRKELTRLRSEGELSWGNPDSLTSGPYLRTIPGVHPCDGFFAAILQKS